MKLNSDGRMLYYDKIEQKFNEELTKKVAQGLRDYTEMHHLSKAGIDPTLVESVVLEQVDLGVSEFFESLSADNALEIDDSNALQELQDQLVDYLDDEYDSTLIENLIVTNEYFDTDQFIENLRSVVADNVMAMVQILNLTGKEGEYTRERVLDELQHVGLSLEDWGRTADETNGDFITEYLSDL